MLSNRDWQMPRALLASLMLCGPALVPAAAQSPVFEVASVRLNEDQMAPSIAPGMRNGRLMAQRATLRQLVAAAYGMTTPRVLGAASLDTNRFDIVAKAPEGVSDSAM